MSHLFSSSRSPPKRKSNSPPLKKSLRFDDKSNLITLIPHDNTFFQDTFLPASGSCDTERLHSKVFTDRTQSAEYMNTIVVPLETPFKRPPMTTLNLSGNNLSQFPVEVLKLETLCALNLSHNHLESLPETISSLTNLDTLNVSFNSLKSLPKTLVKLDKLKDLCIEGNQISKLGDEVTGLVGLKTLNIMHNCLENLPTSLHNLDSLTTFSLEWFSYTSPELDTTQNGKEGFKVIRKLLTECKRLHDEGIHHLNFQDFITTFSTGTETLDTVRSNGSTLLHRACHNGDTSVAKFLIEHSSIMINKEDNENMTPLSVSVLQNNTDIILALLKKGAKYDKACGHYGYPITLATRKGNVAVVKELLKLGEDPNRSDTNLNTALHHAVILMADGYLQAGQIIQTLLDYGANPNAENKEKWTPFHLAVRKKSTKTIQWLLKCNVELQEVHGREDIFNINKRGGPYKWSPMHIASYTNLPDLVQVLADAGADVFKRNAFGYTTKTGISKPGINLVLAQKYEKEMIKKHFITVEKKAKAEESKRQRFQTVPDDLGVRFASRNRFEESLHVRDSLLEDQFLAKKFGIVFPKRKLRANPRWQSMQMEKPGEEDFYDIMQPTEPSNRTHHQPAQSISIGVRGDVNQTDIDEDFTADPNLCINVIPNFGNRARLIDRTKRILKGEKSTDYVVNMEIGDYKARLLKKLDFDFEFCQKELNAFHECLTSLEVSLVDKLKTIGLLKRLYEVIVEYVLRIYKIPMAKKMFPYYVAREMLTRNLEEECKSSKARPKICQIVEFNNLIPNTLIKSYANLKGNEYEVRMLKVNICQFLCELKNLAGLKFLLNVVKAPLEGAIVKREAQNSIETLKTQLLCNNWVG